MEAEVSFVHLHVHSNFSFLDGGSHIENLVKQAAELCQPALALTDHNGLYGAVRFAKACDKYAIKPLYGAEIQIRSMLCPSSSYVAAPSYHLVLLAENREGYANLCQLLSDAHLADKTRKFPVATFEMLKQYAPGLICLTGCRQGEVGFLVDRGQLEAATKVLSLLADIFTPQNLFVELQSFNYGQNTLHRSINAISDVGKYPDGHYWNLSCLAYCAQLLELAKKCDLPVVITNNVHYATPSDYSLHLVCQAVGQARPLPSFPPASSQEGERYLKSRAQLEKAFALLFATEKTILDKAFANTLTIADRCEVDLGLGRFCFPKTKLPEGETAYSLLAKRCFRGLAKKYRPIPSQAVALLEKELKLIEQMGFAPYFLVVHDIVRWAKKRGIPCSGRGSAGNSIICYVLDITASDPLRHGLLFERFLNPSRREMPDIDVDFCSKRRDEVIDYIYKRFGFKNVAAVANVNTTTPRSAVRLVARAIGLPPSEINALSRNVPRHGNTSRIREYLAGEWPELRDSPLQDETKWGPLLDLVERLDSFPLNLSTHLAGFVIADQPVTYYCPLQWAAKGVIVTQLNKDDIAALGLIKMDILGLKTHSAIAETVELIKQRTGKRIDPFSLSLDDQAAYEIIQNGNSIGIFQLESPGQRNLATRLKQQNFADIVAAVALYRPGPLEAEMITPFVERRWGRSSVTVPHPSMAAAVADTYGVILYQEQVLRIARDVAGFDLAEADSLRRAMTRDRSREEMAKIGEDFIRRAVARGVPEEAAREIFRQLEGFAAYGFCKSHAVCFALITYATAWLKAHYPAEFYCALLNNQPMGFYSPRVVLNEARRLGIDVRPLDINLSHWGFIVEDDRDASRDKKEKKRSALRVGFSYLKNMSERAFRRISEERRHKPFESFEDFYLRTRLEYPAAENLIRVGAFDSLEPSRTELLWQLSVLHERVHSSSVMLNLDPGQQKVFSFPPFKAGLKEELSPKEKVSIELDLLGLNITCHPLSLYEKELRELGVTMSHELPHLEDDTPVIVAGIYERAQNPWVRSGKRTMFLTLEDAYGLIECVCFNSRLHKIAPVVARGGYLMVHGRLQNNPRRGLVVVAEKANNLEDILAQRLAMRRESSVHIEHLASNKTRPR